MFIIKKGGNDRLLPSHFRIFLSLFGPPTKNYIYIYMCVCVCVCVFMFV